MEFPGITAGGGFAGTGGESSSFRHGLFDETVGRVEMVLANGEIVTAGRDERTDLFRTAPGAVGTFGIVTLLEINLILANKYVRIRYHRTRSVTDAVKLVREETAKPENDYTDYGVIITGKLTDEKPEDVKPQTFSGAWDPWFYLHDVEERASIASQDNFYTPQDDYIPLAEYLFRYDRGAFWVGQFNCMHWLLPFNRGFDTGIHHTFTIQDIALPFETAKPFVDYLEQNHSIWPLWLCPMKRRPPPTFHPFTTLPGGGGEDNMMLNIGVWGHEGTSDPPTLIAKNRAIEDKVRSLGGPKWLYAHVYQPEDDFWTVYGGRGLYDELRAKYHASALPSVYDKVHVRWDDVHAGTASRGWTVDHFAWLKAYWPIGGIWSAAISFVSGDRALHRNASWKWKEKE